MLPRPVGFVAWFGRSKLIVKITVVADYRAHLLTGETF
jgi:hypothetical protein